MNSSPETSSKESVDSLSEVEMDYVFGSHADWSLVDDLLSGCSCQETCGESCFCQRHGSPYQEGLLSASFLQNNATYPIFECNQSCRCSRTCPNRLVQNFLKNPSHLVVRSMPGAEEERGLFTEADIAAGSCVCVFLGEVIDASEAARREAEQMRRFRHTYILGFCEQAADPDAVAQWTFVDGKADVGVSSELWPVAAFANHSCDPNCVLLPVRVDRMIPYLVLFARRPLQTGEEITFDYGAGDAAARASDRQCLCGTAQCRGFLPRNSAAFR